jgi:uncharacterized repeat protein (TIGR04140 family)
MRVLITPISPQEIEEILRRSGAEVELEIRETAPFHGMPRWEIRVKGSPQEIEKFLSILMRSRAGG